ncbi:MAG: glycosyltransferase family 4 protein [Solirubrobacterales bacterium]|nr:glycosyltransferase family 4 protein [Solirubrobacterales bacterium]
MTTLEKKSVDPPTVPARPNRVLLIAHAFSPERNRRQLSELGTGVELRVLAPRSFQETWGSAAPPEPVNYEWKEFGILQFVPHQYLALSATLGMREFDPDVIHVDYPAWSLVYWQCLLFRTIFARHAKIVCAAKKNTFRAPRGVRGALKTFVSRLGTRAADHIEASSRLSESMLESALGVSSDEISVIPHMGVDTEIFNPATRSGNPNDPIIVGYCGKYSEHKGLMVLLEAAQKVRASGVDLELRLVGSGPMNDYLNSFASQNSWLDVGPESSSTGVAEFMRGLDIYVLPALICPDHQEHDGHALIQALASGVASIGTDSGVIPDILGDGAGILVPSGDPDTLANAIWTLAADEDLRSSYADASLKLVSERYTLEAVAEARRLMYGSLADQSSTPV